MHESETKLVNGCNLVRRGTHGVYRRFADKKVFVRDIKLKFPFSEGEALTKALDAANEAFNEREGCAGCPLYSECLPSPESISASRTELALAPALLTSFD